MLNESCFLRPIDYISNPPPLAIIVACLLHHGAKHSLLNHWGRTPLDLAKETNQHGIARLLKKHGARTGVEQTPLHWAVKHNQIELLKRFLSIRLGEDGCCLALEYDSSDHIILSSCIDKAIQYDTIDYLQRTALHWAAEENRSSAVRILLYAGVNLNVEDHAENTPLHLAIEKGHTFIVKLLCAKEDLDIDLRNALGKCPIDLAREKCAAAHLSEEKDTYKEILLCVSKVT